MIFLVDDPIEETFFEDVLDEEDMLKFMLMLED